MLFVFKYGDLVAFLYFFFEDRNLDFNKVYYGVERIFVEIFLSEEEDIGKIEIF